MNKADNKLKYRPDIDGMRAIAVTAVVIFHAGLGLPGGFVGVDVFFVISGFLITAIVVREIQNQEFTWFGFWERRVRRLFPAMAVAVASTVIMGWFVLLPHDLKELGQSLVAQSFALSNIFFWRECGYFAGPSEIKPLLHTWSLSVEEQFYLFLPGIALIAHKVFRNILATLIVGFICSLAFCIYQTQASPDAAFFLLPARAWELLLGGIVALIGPIRFMKRNHGQALSLLGLVAVCASFVFYDKSISFPGSFALIPCIGTAFMILGDQVEGGTLVSGLLSKPPIVFVGLISYSLYLWHWPLFAYANYLSPDGVPLGISITLLVTSFALGALSWYFVETPFRKKKAANSRPKNSWLPAAVVTVLLLAGLGITLHLNQGFRNRFAPETLRFADSRTDKNPQRRDHHDLSRSRLSAAPKLLVQGDSSVQPLVVIGDSHADALMPGIVALCEKYQLPVIAYTRSATPPLLFSEGRNDQEAYFYETVQDFLGDSQTKHVLLIGRWSKYDVVTKATLTNNLDRFAEQGIDVIVGTAIPEPLGDAPRFLALSQKWGFSDEIIRRPKSEFVDEQKTVLALLHETADSHQNARLIDLAEPFFESNKELSLVQLDGQPLYFDDNHLSSVGAKFAALPLESEIAQIAKEGSLSSQSTTSKLKEQHLESSY